MSKEEYFKMQNTICEVDEAVSELMDYVSEHTDANGVWKGSAAEFEELRMNQYVEGLTIVSINSYCGEIRIYIEFVNEAGGEIGLRLA